MSIHRGWGGKSEAIYSLGGRVGVDYVLKVALIIL